MISSGIVNWWQYSFIYCCHRIYVRFGNKWTVFFLSFLCVPREYLFLIIYTENQFIFYICVDFIQMRMNEWMHEILNWILIIFIYICHVYSGSLCFFFNSWNCYLCAQFILFITGSILHVFIIIIILLLLLLLFRFELNIIVLSLKRAEGSISFDWNSFYYFKRI